jgi:hypothetical protein
LAIDGGKDIHLSEGQKGTVIQQIQEYIRLDSAVTVTRAVCLRAVFLEPYFAVLFNVQEMAFQRVSERGMTMVQISEAGAVHRSA